MELTYLESANVISAITEHLNEVTGDLAIELFEMEIQLEDAFRAHTKRTVTLQKEVQVMRSSAGEGEKPSQKQRLRLMEINDEIQSIYEKKKKFDFQPFTYGDGGDRDLQPYLNLAGLRKMRPVINLKKQPQ